MYKDIKNINYIKRKNVYQIQLKLLINTKGNQFSKALGILMEKGWKPEPIFIKKLPSRAKVLGSLLGEQQHQLCSALHTHLRFPSVLSPETCLVLNILTIMISLTLADFIICNKHT